MIRKSTECVRHVVCSPAVRLLVLTAIGILSYTVVGKMLYIKTYQITKEGADLEIRSNIRTHESNVKMDNKQFGVVRNSTLLGVVRGRKVEHDVVMRNKAHVDAFKRYYVYFDTNYTYENIMAMKPIKFDPLYKNPCWIGTADNGPLDDNTLHCLPYFHIIGMKKSGSTDLFSRLVSHPDVTAQVKEPAWFSMELCNRIEQQENTNNEDHNSISYYIKNFFDGAAKTIHSHPSNGSNPFKYNMITMDATPCNLIHHGNWTVLSGNEGLTEPRYTNLHFINHLTPKAKIIIIIRDPVTRLFSDFLHTTNHYDITSMTPSTFHEHVTTLTDTYKECFSRWSIRRCIYNETIRVDLMKKGILLADSFIGGFIAFYMKELLAVFGRERIHTILTMEYERDMENILRKTFDFLNLSPLPQSKLNKIVHKGKRNVKNEQRNKVGPMLNHTRDMLYDFYEPYNKEMADLLNDSRYLFRKTQL